MNNPTNQPMVLSTLEVLKSDLCKLPVKMSKDHIPVLERCLEHISFLIKVYDDKPVDTSGMSKFSHNLTTFQNNIFTLLNKSARATSRMIKDSISDLKKPKPNRKAYIINGAGGSGKDTFVNIVKTVLQIEEKYKHINVLNVSSVDKVKQAAHLLGWDGEKDSKGRAFLHKLKTLSEAEYEGVKKYVLNKVEVAPDDSIIFIHIREPEEIQKTIEVLSSVVNVSTSTILVRSSRGINDTNGADDVVENFNYDFSINNSGTIGELEEIVKAFITHELT